MFINPFFKNKGPFKFQNLIYNKKTGLNSKSAFGSLSKRVLSPKGEYYLLDLEDIVLNHEQKIINKINISSK